MIPCSSHSLIRSTTKGLQNDLKAPTVNVMMRWISRTWSAFCVPIEELVKTTGKNTFPEIQDFSVQVSKQYMSA